MDLGGGSEFHAAGPDDYAYADYYWFKRDTWWGATIAKHQPFFDHYDYRNFVLNQTNVYQDPNDGWWQGFLNTGVSDGFWGLTLNLPATFGYLPDFSATNVPTLLPLPGTRNILQIWARAEGEWPEIGVSEIRTPTNVTLTLETSARNIFGLPYAAMKLARPGDSAFVITNVQAGGSIDAQSDQGAGCIYPEVANPVLQNSGYYFCNPNIGPFPGYTNFSTTNQSPMLICGVGDPTFQVAGHAKYSILNGYTDKFAYLGQYFEKAYRANTNGTRSTNETGILSPYGEFFATEPGKTFLTTKPDGVSTNIGECVVNVISLSVDGNHDGTMDFSFSGPDSVSVGRPYRFWVNDDDDKGEAGKNDIPGGYPKTADALDGNMFYGKLDGVRDLVDFFPVSINIQSLLQVLPPSFIPQVSYVLIHEDEALNFIKPHLRPDQVRSYLTDTNVAQDLAPNYTDAVTTERINAFGTPLDSQFLNGIRDAGQSLILVEARKPTTKPLILEVRRGSEVVARAELPLSITGVEQMFRHKNLVLETFAGSHEGAKDRLTDASVPNEPVTSSKNFVFLHGYNVNPLQAVGWQAEIFKRMYWSGSQAKFYAVTWRAYESQIRGALTPNLQTNVVNAFLTAPHLKDFLGTLTNGSTVVCGHSLGNMLALAALNDLDARMDKLLMIDAAVALEAVDGSAAVNTNMIHSDWLNYPPRVFASHWFRLFPTNDGRATLTWSNVSPRRTHLCGERVSGQTVRDET